MRETQEIPQQANPLQESTIEKIRVANGGSIRGTEGGLRADLFEHDDPIVDEAPCLCDLPDLAQDILYEEREVEDSILDA